jgi:SAM-dependent methyltransferase
MYDWIAELKPGQIVLDVCSGPGSFPGLAVECTAIALDEDVDAFRHGAAPAAGHVRVFARSDLLPFPAASIDLVICHHGLEHVIKLDETLAEIARVLKPDGRIFVSVPNGYGLCDAIYRFVFEGGGHVNRYRRKELVAMVERAVGVKLVKWQKLYSSFVYLWRLAEMLQQPAPILSPWLMRFRRLPRRAITGAQRVLYSGTRVLDRLLHTDLAVYGWAFYFDRAGGVVEEVPAYLNVCRGCGVGHPAAGIEHPTPGRFRCVSCNLVNPYFEPFGNTE